MKIKRVKVIGNETDNTYVDVASERVTDAHVMESIKNALYMGDKAAADRPHGFTILITTEYR